MTKIESSFLTYQSEDSAIRANSVTASWRKDGKAFLISAANSTKIYADTFEILGSIANTKQAVFSPDGKVIGAMNSVDQKLYVYDAMTFTEITHFDHQILSFIFSPDSHFIAGIDNTDRQSIYLYDLNKLNLAQTVALKSPTQIIRFSPDSRYLAMSRASTLDVWDTTKNQYDGQIQIEEAFGLQSLSWSLDSQEIAVVSGQNRINIIRRDSGQVIHMLNITDHITDIAEDERTYILAWSPDNNQLPSASQVSTYSAYPNDNSVQIWDTQIGKMQLFLQAQHVTILAWNPQGNVLATGSYSYDPLNMYPTSYATVGLWNPETGELFASSTKAGRIQALTWSPDGSNLLAVHDDGAIYLAEINADGQVQSGKTLEKKND